MHPTKLRMGVGFAALNINCYKYLLALSTTGAYCVLTQKLFIFQCLLVGVCHTK